jgi:hypothetical protein
MYPHTPQLSLCAYKTRPDMVLSLKPVPMQVEIRDVQGECADSWVQWQIPSFISGGEKLTGENCVLAYFPTLKYLA